MTPWPWPALLNHLWQSTLFVLLVWLATLTLRKNGARVRFGLWTASSVKFLIPIAVLVGLGERMQWREAPQAMQPAVLFVMQDVLAPAAVVISAQPPSVTPPAPLIWPWILAAVWGLGAAVVLGTWWRQWRPIRSALRQATPLRLDTQYGADDLSIMSSPSMPEPGVVGIHRPRLLLPEGLVQRVTPAQLRALLAHERCHVRWRDNLVAAIHMAVETVFWFHPLVWWIETRLVDERERACDEAVLRSGSRPQDYAEAILEVCRQSVGVRPVCVTGVSGSNLRKRVEAIMRNEVGRPLTQRRQWAVGLIVAATAAVPVVGGALMSQSQEVVPPAGLAFEAASITRSAFPFPPPDASPSVESLTTAAQKASISVASGSQVTRISGPLHVLIQVAYAVSRLQVEWGAPWVRSVPYSVEARTRSGATQDEVRGMLQSLLAERFGLSLSREARILPVYELVLADGGAKLGPMTQGDCVAPGSVRWDLIDLEAPLFVCGPSRRRTLSQNPETRPRPRWPRVDRIEAGRVPIDGLIDLISGDVDRVIVNRTGFGDRINLVLDFAAEGNPKLRLPPSSGPTIFEALEEQLGLRLQPATAAVDVLVIERAEEPALN
jgi:uncharacterized protein (TIGR03435 family)